MAKPDRNPLLALHGKLAKTYEAMLENLPLDEIPPSLLTSIANFLKHNGIVCEAEVGDDDQLNRLRDVARDKLYPFDPDEAPH